MSIGSVNVAEAAIEAAIVNCQKTIEELKKNSDFLNSQYQEAWKSGFKDQQSISVGKRIEECTYALIKPIRELEKSEEQLRNLLRIVSEYENR